MQTEKVAVSAFVLPGAPDDAGQFIRPARGQRKWMDSTPEKYAYRCTPLSAANTLGWEILNPVLSEFIWNGMTPPEQIFIYQQPRTKYGPRSHFGSGVVTWDLPFLFRTPPGYGLMVTGPSNHDHANVTPLDGLIRTDWLPFPFTVNWRITVPGETIRFEQHEPIARVFPVALDMVDEMHLDLHDLADDPKLQQQFSDWSRQRQQSYQRRRQKTQQPTADANYDRKEYWGRDYVKGVRKDDSAERRPTVFAGKPVVDRRKPRTGGT